MAVSKVTVTLPSDLEAFIDARVVSGRSATAGDGVREGLRLLEAREQQRDAVLAELRPEIEVGVAEAKAGQLRNGRTFCEELRQNVRSASMSDFLLAGRQADVLEDHRFLGRRSNLGAAGARDHRSEDQQGRPEFAARNRGSGLRIREEQETSLCRTQLSA